MPYAYCACSLGKEHISPKNIKEETMTILKRLAVFAIGLILALSLAACSDEKKEGPAEEMGKKIDQTMDQAQETAKDIQKDLTGEKGPAEKAGEKIDETMQEMQGKKE